MSTVTRPRRRWVHYGACAWAVLFGAPHTWWALGIPFGFPGGEANHKLLVTTWRLYGDIVVIGLCVLAVLVALAPIQRWGAAIPRWVTRSMAWVACGLLSLRGVAGLIHDGLSQPVWTLSFVIGGILFGGVAWNARARPGA